LPFKINETFHKQNKITNVLSWGVTGGIWAVLHC